MTELAHILFAVAVGTAISTLGSWWLSKTNLSPNYQDGALAVSGLLLGMFALFCFDPVAAAGFMLPLGVAADRSATRFRLDAEVRETTVRLREIKEERRKDFLHRLTGAGEDDS